MESKKKFTFESVADYLLIPLFIAFCAYEPNYLFGVIDHLEAGQFLSVINEMFHGRALFKDTFMLYGPLHYYLPALALGLFGKSLAVLRAYFHFGSIFSLISAYFLGRSILKSRLASYLLAFFLIVEVNHPFWSSRTGGIRMGLGLLILLCLVYFLRKKKNIWLVLAGLLNGFAILYSLEIGVFSFIAAILAILVAAEEGRQDVFVWRGKKFLYYLAGIFLCIVPFSVYFYLQAALWPYLQDLLNIPQHHLRVWSQPIPVFMPPDLNPANLLSWLFSAQFKIFLPIFIYAFVAIYVTIRLLRNKVDDELRIIILLTVYGSLLYGVSFRAILGPQFQAALPPLLILICFFLEHMYLSCRKQFFSNTPQLKKILVAFFCICIVSLSSIYFIFSEKRYYFSLKNWFLYQIDKKYFTPSYMMPIPLFRYPMFPLEIDRARGMFVPLKQKEEIEGVVRYICQNTRLNDPVFAFPEQGIYNFFTDRPAIDRFTIAGLAWARKEHQDELLADLKRIRPQYVIFGKYLSNLSRSIAREEELLPQISQYIRKNYILVKSFNTVDIYHLKENAK